MPLNAERHEKLFSTGNAKVEQISTKRTEIWLRHSLVSAPGVILPIKLEIFRKKLQIFVYPKFPPNSIKTPQNLSE